MKYAISAGHEATGKAAVEIIRSGGNVFDAALGAYMASFISEPAMGSPGAGAFALAVTESGKQFAFDFFCHTPREKRSLEECEVFVLDVDFGNESERFYGGMGTVAVPGAMDGIHTVHEILGKLPMAELVKPALRLCREGVRLNSFQVHDLNLLLPVFSRSEDGRQLLFNGRKRKEVGDRAALPKLADFLEAFAREGKELFYKGEVGKSLIEDSRDRGGQLTEEDLKHYHTRILAPSSLPQRSGRLLYFPPPSQGGRLLRFLVSRMEQATRVGDWRSDKHLESLYGSFKKADELKRSPDFHRLNPSYTNYRGSTSHLNVMDDKGNAMALTTTIGEGSGYFIPGFQIHMNNMLGEPSLLPGGLNSWIPDSRLSSMMAPAITVGREGKTELVMGSGGASRIPFVLAQVWENVYRFGDGLEHAIQKARSYYAKPIFHLEESGGEVTKVEAGDEIRHWEERSLFFGGVHALYMDAEGRLSAAGDRRREGWSVVVEYHGKQ